MHIIGNMWTLWIFGDNVEDRMGPVRFLTEMVRAEPPVMWIGSYGLSFSMVLSFLFVISGAALWYAFGKVGDRAEWSAQAAPLPA